MIPISSQSHTASARRPLLRSAVLLLAATVPAGSGRAEPADRLEPFAIETKIQDGAGRHVASHWTWFTATRIYDHSPTPPEQVIWWDRTAGRFTLADITNRTKTQVDGEDLVRFVELERQRALKSSDPLIRFAADPKFDVAWDEASQRLTLTSPSWDYEVRCQPPASAAQEQVYFEFARWFTRLNALFRPLPPGVRMRLNHELQRRHRLPTQVRVRLKRDGRVIATQQSSHVIHQPVTAQHREQIDRWQQQAARFSTVAIDVFRQSLSPQH